MCTINFFNKSLFYFQECHQSIGNFSFSISRRILKIKPRLRNLFSIIFLIFGFCTYGVPKIIKAQGPFLYPQDEPNIYQKSKHRNKFNLADIPQLHNKVEKVYAGGNMRFFNGTNISDKEILRWLNVTNESTFKKQTEQLSRFENGILNMKFKQFYKGIEVENGGYAIKSTGKNSDGSFSVKQFTPFLMYDLNLDTTPSVQKEEIGKILGFKPIEKCELIISDRFSGTFQLVWKVRFRDPQTKYAWLDAKTGKTLRIDDGMMYINAPTEDYGPKPMQDVIISNRRYLQTDADPVSNGGVVTYDFDLTSYFEIGIPEYSSSLIPSISSSEAWTTGDAAGSVFQAHYITTQIKDKYLSDFGISHGLLHIGANSDNCFWIEIIGQDPFCLPDPRAGTFKESTIDEGWIIFSHKEGSTYAEYDVLGHELAHVYMNELLNPYVLSSLSLQEGIADMFGVYMESQFQSLDWDMGDNIPDIKRNLQNPVFPCFEEAMNSTEAHNRGSALGFWFYNLVTED